MLWFSGSYGAAENWETTQWRKKCFLWDCFFFTWQPEEGEYFVVNIVEQNGTLYAEFWNRDNVACFDTEGRQTYTCELRGTACFFQENGEGFVECVTTDTNDIIYNGELSNLSIDPDIWTVIWEETAPYFAGDKSVQEVAHIIQGRVQIILAE